LRSAQSRSETDYRGERVSEWEFQPNRNEKGLWLENYGESAGGKISPNATWRSRADEDGHPTSPEKHVTSEIG